MDALELYKQLYAIAYVAGRCALQMIKDGKTVEAADWLRQELDRTRDMYIEWDYLH